MIQDLVLKRPRFWIEDFQNDSGGLRFWIKHLQNDEEGHRVSLTRHLFPTVILNLIQDLVVKRHRFWIEDFQNDSGGLRFWIKHLQNDRYPLTSNE
ncbi:hypothetical protein [Kosmotoga sp. DU53]|uniref:hypothetical protein n=1 Tax=Kosmotoga sp. DU53 TaxID=1310160 RepID=UPI0007C5C741|nr:hypothetical protein [Kosmotoga sp. DU53]